MMLRLLVPLMFLASIPAFGSLVVNGTFDDTCASWNYVRNSNFCDTGSGNPSPSLILNDNPGFVPFAYQDISGLVTGTTYTISLDAKTFYNCCNSATVPGAGVAIDGHQFDFLVVNGQPWTSYSFSFTYDGGDNRLTLSSQRNGTDSDAQFDNVSLTGSTATPEPADVLLIGGGLLALVSLRRATRISDL